MAICLVSGSNAGAEQADRTKPVEVEADVANVDQSKRTKTLEGNAILTQGTMRLTAERIVIMKTRPVIRRHKSMAGPMAKWYSGRNVKVPPTSWRALLIARNSMIRLTP